jgi:probable HAF family extracellular repeat protein
MRCRSLALLVVLATATIFAAAQTYNFTTLDYPGAKQTNPNDINRTGVVVGGYYDSNSTLHGFAYYNGSFVAIDFPGATFTSANGINSKGVIVGHFGGQSGTHGFVLQDGQFTQVDVPGSTYTDVEGINDAGVLGGSYLDFQQNP